MVSKIEANKLIDRVRDTALSHWATRMEWLERKASDAEMKQSEKDVASARAALIALLARDDARIARLEEVARAARALINFDGLGDHPEIAENLLAQGVVDALALLDADAPGGG